MNKWKVRAYSVTNTKYREWVLPIAISANNKQYLQEPNLDFIVNLLNKMPTSQQEFDICVDYFRSLIEWLHKMDELNMEVKYEYIMS
jgi:hypothetical protein